MISNQKLMFVCHCYKKETCCDCHTKKRDGRSYVIPNDFRGKIDGIQSVRSTNWFQIKSSFKMIASTNDISYYRNLLIETKVQCR